LTEEAVHGKCAIHTRIQQLTSCYKYWVSHAWALHWPDKCSVA